MSREWEAWQQAWRVEEPTPGPPAIVVLERALSRHRRLAWVYTTLDVLMTIALSAIGVFITRSHPVLPTFVLAASIFVFSAALLGFLVWNRRDALFVSGQTATSFLAQMLLRLRRRERLPRLLLVFGAAEVTFSLSFFAVWSPRLVAPAAGWLLIVALVMVAWLAWYGRRLREERAQLESLRADIEREAK
jgi:hypothetical protein